MSEIIAAADGSALGNPGPAGWAWYIDDNHWAAGGWEHGTNNMGELKAVLDLFEATAHMPERKLVVYCDSQYVINSLTKWMPGWKSRGWKKADGKPVLNRELLQELDAATAARLAALVRQLALADKEPAESDQAEVQQASEQPAEGTPGAEPGRRHARASLKPTGQGGNALPILKVAEFRDASGLGRKRAVQMLEFFDRIGLCRRVGDTHVLRLESEVFKGSPE